MTNAVRFFEFSIARLHLYQGISAKITLECSLEKLSRIIHYRSKMSSKISMNTHDTLDNIVYPQAKNK